MTFFNFNTTPAFAHSVSRRDFIVGISLGLGATLLPIPLYATELLEQILKPATAAQVQAIIDDFLKGEKPLEQGIKLTMPVLGDNPAAVPLKVAFDLSVLPDFYCEELIILAEGNPYPLACRFKFTALAGTTEVAVRLRLIESQSVSAIARMSNGQFLLARQHITVTAGGCGM